MRATVESPEPTTRHVTASPNATCCELAGTAAKGPRRWKLACLPARPTQDPKPTLRSVPGRRETSTARRTQASTPTSIAGALRRSVRSEDLSGSHRIVTTAIAHLSQARLRGTWEGAAKRADRLFPIARLEPRRAGLRTHIAVSEPGCGLAAGGLVGRG